MGSSGGWLVMTTSHGHPTWTSWFMF